LTTVFFLAMQIREYDPLTVAVGDTVTFSWRGFHGVAEIDSEDCPVSFDNILAPETSSGEYEWTATEPGTYYLACQVGSHCSSGQKIKITVE